MKKIEKTIEKTYGYINSVYAPVGTSERLRQAISNFLQLFRSKIKHFFAVLRYYLSVVSLYIAGLPRMYTCTNYPLFAGRLYINSAPS